MQIDQFIDSALKSFDLSAFDLLDEKLAKDSLKAEWDELQELNSRDTLQARWNFFKIPGTRPEDYQERIIETDRYGSVLAGIRHRSGEATEPFIQIWPSFELCHFAQIEVLAHELTKEFESFTPKSICFWINPNSEIAKSLEVNYLPSQRYVVGEVGRINTLQPPDAYEKIKLTPIKDDSYRSWYEKLYEQFHEDLPDLRTWVVANDPDDMEESIDQGLIFYASLGSEPLGLIAGTRESLLGRKGVYINEIAVDRKFKGKGLAPAIQRRFIDSVIDKSEIVWGTIDAKNIASTKTALRVGRRPIRSEYFFEVKSL